jgi:transcriptional regulator with XRE-family HTH domain
MEDLRDYSSTRDRIFRESAEVRTLWKRTALKRRIGFMLAHMRHATEVSQKHIAESAGWDKGFVSRLEGANGGVPDLQTLARFADKCGLAIGLVVCERPTNDRKNVRVIDAVSLFDEPRNHDDFSYLDEPNLFGNLIDKTLTLK